MRFLFKRVFYSRVSYNSGNTVYRKHFSTQRYFSDPKDGVVAILLDQSKNGTSVNEKMLGSDVRCGLKNQDTIGFIYYTKDMNRNQCAAFRFSLLDSVKVSGNDTYPNIIETFPKGTRNQKNVTNMDFFSNESVELISDVEGSRTPSNKRKHCSKKSKK